ncbi:sulfite oxidase heme-binding subunit YedZ [Arenimonas fontis]|uniref:Protein-methionine-sulfoxide reductase heme-binding subunit MsrQ n=1 Tax=Arenimonas fontis TaxID=2608255 RepID=A0A5B2ZEI3_9GAMM|nr:protein-methionine-sulfoxide reductase heme-binding subunit MsrQ [Arenimonas fontis]KAA2285993.1 sulfoxide reductase heme-binding subunit YedZ [Arenimonas fontis]
MVLSRVDWRWFWFKAAAHVLLLAPLAHLAWRAIRADLGPDPVAALTHGTGDWALRLLLVCLAMTPLRRLSGRSWPIRFRRMLGLYAFFYACLHLGVYLVLDLGAYWRQILEDIVLRPYVTAGFSAWLLLLALALTSTRGWMRRLGRRWGQLHKAVYAAGILAVLHYLWLVKADLREPLLYAALLAVLLGLRLGWHWRHRRRPVAAQPTRGA